MKEVPDIVLFLGRFHPLVVHLPIGFLLLAIIMEFLSRRPNFQKLKPSIKFVWLLGAVSGSVAVLFGYLLSLDGGYNRSTLLWHQWGGITTTLLAFVCYLATEDYSKLKKVLKSKGYSILVVTTLVLLTLTGHYGGNLTHGPDYLVEYAPQPIRAIIGLPEKQSISRKRITSLDSADIFVDAIMPILSTRCMSCHNTNKVKGGLVLNSFDNIMKGGDTGRGLIAGDADNSELFRRVSLPQDHEDFMPPNGKSSLSNEQIDIIKWWIDKGALSEALVTSLNPEQDLINTFNNYFSIGKDEFLLAGAPPLNRAVIDDIESRGFVINQLAEKGNFLEVNLSVSEATAKTVDLTSLMDLKDQLIWLQLANCDVSDEDLMTVGQLKNLRKLNLSKNKLTDQGIEYLGELSKLEYLNLYGNKITKKSIETFKKMTQLKSLYLWQTDIEPEAIQALKIEMPELLVIYTAPTL